MTFVSARFVIAKFVIAAVTLAVMAGGAQAQSMGGGGGHKHQQKADKSAEQKPKVDDKAYAAALKSVPDKPYDPWHAVR
jgi:hypothetical protein